MARFVVPVAVLVALVGGYVAGQQPGPTSGREVGGSNPHYQWSGGDSDVGKVQVSGHAPTVGRYVPFGVGMMLDTTNGTLYAMGGNSTRWTVAAEFDETPQADVVAPRTNP